MSELRARPSAARRLPPGPTNTYPFGQTTAFVRDQVGATLGMARRYGPVARVPFGVFPTLYLVSGAAGLQRVLQDNARAYRKNPTTNVLFRFLTGGQNLFTADGEYWLRQRRLMQPAFHRERLASFVAGMSEAAAGMLGRWSRLEPGAPLDLEREMMTVTLSVVGRALFSLDLGDRASELGRAYLQLTRYFTYRQTTPVPPPLWVPTAMNRATSKAKTFVEAEIGRIVAQRRASGETRDDLLSMLLEARHEDGSGMSDEELRSEISLFLVAGHETTATALTWAFHMISQHPEVEARLRAELEAVLGGRSPTVEDLPRLEHTRRAFEETLRLYPPAWAVARLAAEADEVEGHAIPKGANLVLLVYGVHRDPAYWDEPERFDPDRFLPEAARTRPRFAYVPFGGGPRQCIGNTFALMEAQVILAAVLQRYRVRTTPAEPVEPWALFTLRPRRGMPAVLEPLP